jgi:hypothetical protein
MLPIFIAKISLIIFNYRIGMPLRCTFCLPVKSLLIWFGGLELPVLVPVSDNQTGTYYDLGTSITGINIYVFEEPDPELEWELRFLRKKKGKKNRD